jgi:ATP/maltotriose-dependent transcriptional regulator MalT
MAYYFDNLGIVRRHSGDLAGAEQLFDKAIAAARLHKHRSLGPTLADLAELQCATGRASSAMKSLDEAAPLMKSDYPDDPWRAAWVDNVRGECLLRSGQAANGERLIATSAPAIFKRWQPNTLYAAEAQRRLRLRGKRDT